MIADDVRRLRDQGRPDLALSHLKEAAAGRQHDPAALQQFGVLFRELGDLDQAEAAFRRAAVLAPDSPFVQVNIAIVLQERGEVAAAADLFRAAAAARPNKLSFVDNVLMNAQYIPGVTAESLFYLHSQWRDRFAGPPRPQPQARPASDRPLRLGFLSADFARHPVGYFLLPLFKSLDRRASQVVAFASGRRRDQMSDQFRQLADGWHEIGEMSDPAAAALIEQQNVDILFDMAGHAFNNRLGVFALRPAPIQVSWAGYVGTVGVPAIDFVLADAIQAPPSEDCFYHEHVLRMPRCYVPYYASDEAPTVGPLPAQRNGFITFGCFNSPSKLNSEVIELWAQLLAGVPASRLSLRFRGVDATANVRRIQAVFADAGVAPDRLSFAGVSSHRQMLEAYNNVDIALDPFPYSGGVTTCEALWMGVPVVTMTGASFAGRHSTMYLNTVGLRELISTTKAQYLAVAADMCGDLDELSRLRVGLRNRVSASPLLDHAGFAADFLALMTRVAAPA